MFATVTLEAPYQGLKTHTSNTLARPRYVLQIVDANQVLDDETEFSIGTEGVTISQEGDGENIHTSIVASSATFTLYAQTVAQRDLLETIAQAETGRFGVRLRYNANGTPNSTIWVGTLLNDQIQIADSLPQAVTLTAVDDLAHLKNVPYLNDDGERYTGTATVLEHIDNALQKLRTYPWHYAYYIDIVGNLFYNIYVGASIDLTPDSYSADPANDSILEDSILKHSNFYKGGGTTPAAVSCYEVLEAIALYFNLQVYQTTTISAPRILFAPLSGWAKKIDSGADFSGTTWRSNFATYASYGPEHPETDITHGGGDTPREAGGVFSFSRPLKELTRKVEWNSTEPDAYLYVGGTSGWDDWTTGDATYVTEFYGFSAAVGSTQRIQFSFHAYYHGLDAQTIFNETDNTNGGGAVNRFNYMRLRVRLGVRYKRPNGTYRYLRRQYVNAGPQAVYTPFGDLTAADMPVYIDGYDDDFYGLIWGNTDTNRYVMISEPFDATLDQQIRVDADFITPPLDYAAEEIAVYVEARLVGPNLETMTHDNLTLYGFDGNYLLHRMYNYGYTVATGWNINVYPFDGYNMNDGETFTANNDVQGEDLDTGTVIISDNDTATGLNNITYRQSDGTQATETTGFTSYYTAASTYPSAKLVLSEIAAYYKTGRRMYEGTVILNGFSHFHWGSYLQLDSDFYKILRLEYMTARNRIRVEIIQFDSDNTAPPVDFMPYGEDNAPQPPAPFPDAIARTARAVQSLSTSVQPSVTAYTDAASADRTSQTGEAVVTIDSDGKFQEIADGSPNTFLKTDGSGVYSFAKTPKDGWHGSPSLLRIMAHEFVMNDDYNRAPIMFEDDTAGTLGIRLPAASSEAYALTTVPVGYEATHVQVYASASTASAVEVFTYNHTSGAISSVGTGDFNASIDITDVGAGATVNLCVKIIPNSAATLIYGADVTISEA